MCRTYRVWFGEDLYQVNHENNTGNVMFDVYFYSYDCLQIQVTTEAALNTTNLNSYPWDGTYALRYGITPHARSLWYGVTGRFESNKTKHNK